MINRRTNFSLPDGIVKFHCDSDHALLNICLDTHSLTKEDLLSLAGGIPTNAATFFDINLTLVSYADAVISVGLNTSEFACTREIDLKEKVIRNTYACVKETGTGIGTNLLINQVEAAINFGYYTIKVTAMGGKYCPDMNGHYTWGRLGFTMLPGDVTSFKALMFDFGRTERTLNELLSSDDGKDFWCKEGFTWLGEFDLSGHSENRMLLDKYLKEKGLI